MNKLHKLTDILIEEKCPKKDMAMAFVWYHYVTLGTDPTIQEVNEYFVENALSKYNPTYMKEAFLQSKKIIHGSKMYTYRPVKRYQDEMSSKFSFIEIKSEDIVTDDIILPDVLMTSTRGYIELLAKQINASYNNNIFDGCAVLMRRLVEVLLIHSYEAMGRINDISDNDGYKILSYIINYTVSNKPFRLSKEANEVLDDFRQLGNFSAHKIQYNAKRKDVDNIKLKFRMTIEELLYAAKFKK